MENKKEGSQKSDIKMNMKKVFWCSGRPCSLEVEKGRGRWRNLQEFDMVTKELKKSEDVEVEATIEKNQHMAFEDSNSDDKMEHGFQNFDQIEESKDAKMDEEFDQLDMKKTQTVQKSNEIQIIDDVIEKKLKIDPEQSTETKIKRENRQKKSNNDFRSMLGL